MSALDSSPDEHPYIPLLEETLATAEVFVSEESRDALAKDYDFEANRGIAQWIVPNPAPTVYAQISKVGLHSDSPKHIAIISNHSPKNLLMHLRFLQNAFASATRFHTPHKGT